MEHCLEEDIGLLLLLLLVLLLFLSMTSVSQRDA